MVGLWSVEVVVVVQGVVGGDGGGEGYTWRGVVEDPVQTMGSEGGGGEVVGDGETHRETVHPSLEDNEGGHHTERDDVEGVDPHDAYPPL